MPTKPAGSSCGQVGVANVAAQALYRRAGYREIASLPAYYEDGSDACG
ncbi:MAG: hypothetical protein R3E48_13785 [Burkholderiaceae bacterium]